MICPSCDGALFKNYSYRGKGPAFLYMILMACNPVIETEVRLQDENTIYRLCGVIYHTGNHFVARVVDRTGEVWYHDGCTTGEKVKYVKNVTSMSNDVWLSTGSYRALVLMYTKIY